VGASERRDVAALTTDERGARMRTPFRRGPLTMAAWLVAGGVLIAASGRVPEVLGSYGSGFVLLGGMLAAALYVARRRGLLLFLGLIRTVSSLPGMRAFQPAIIRADRLRVWRSAHLAVGILAAVPLWWHVRAARGGLVEEVLLWTVLVVLLTGVLGGLLQYLMPLSMMFLPEREVRTRDVKERRRELYVNAEEKILGRSEELVEAYLAAIRPTLETDTAWPRLLEATVRRSEPSALAQAGTWRAREDLDEEDAKTFDELTALATKKTQLDLNLFHLQLSAGWLEVHSVAVLLTGGLVVLHLVAVLYFGGL